MPHANIWIRKEDWDKWQSVVHKSEFIHNALQDRSTYDGAKIILRETLSEASHIDPAELKQVKIPPTVKVQSTPKGKPVFVPKAQAKLLYCKKHGTPLDDFGKCLQKGHSSVQKGH